MLTSACSQTALRAAAEPRPLNAKLQQAKKQLAKRTILSDILAVNGNELYRKLRKYAKGHGLSIEWHHRRGKGSHGTLLLGNRMAVIPALKTELKKGTLKAILDQLGLRLEDLQN